MSLKAVIFDMDGVIVDTEPEYQKVELELACKYGVPISISEINAYKGVHPIVMWQDIKEKYNLHHSVKELYEEEMNIMETYYRVGKLRVIQPTVSLIKKVHQSGLRIAVVSSSDKVNIFQTLKRLRVRRYFDTVVSGNDVEHSKPYPDAYLLAARLLGVSADECIVIEDSVAGVTSAKAAGMKVIQFTQDTRVKDCVADYSVADIKSVTVSLMDDIMSNK